MPAAESLEGRALLAAFLEFALPAGANPTAITTGPDRNLWFTETNGKIGRISPTLGNLAEFSSGNGEGSTPNAITTGPDGNLWFTDSGTSKVAKITPAGVATLVMDMSPFNQPLGIATGADNNLWVTEGGGGKVSKVPTAGAATHFPTGLTASSPAGITPGPGGDLWFTDKGSSQIARIATADGTVKVARTLAAGSLPLGIVADASNNVWFTESGANKIGTVTATGTLLERTLPTANAVPTSITVDRDGNLWFTERNVGQVGRISPAGVITEFATPPPGGQPTGITTGPDGNIWYTDAAASKIGRIALDQLIVITGNPISPSLNVPFTGAVASFTTSALNAKASNFSAKIDFGNGQVSDGVITPNATGGFDVVGTTTFTAAATSPIRVTVSDLGGGAPGVAAVTATVLAPVAPSTLTVRLDKTSDTGASNSDFITSVDRPTFLGKTAGYAVVQVFALREGSVPSFNRYVGQTIAGPDGVWSLTLTTATLNDGLYTITATATNPGGSPSPPIVLTDDLGTARTLSIDTVGPRVTAIAFSPKNGVVTTVMSDFGAGLDLDSTSATANYTLVSVRTRIGRIVTPQNPSVASIAGFYTKAVGNTIVLTPNSPLKPGTYLFQVLSGGVRDLAGNPLDGEFTAGLPSGNGVRGGNFIVKLTVPKFHPHPKPTHSTTAAKAAAKHRHGGR